MKNIIRSIDGRVQGRIAYWLHNDDEHWKDSKIKGENVRFPQYTGKLHGEVVTYDISELNTK